MVLLVPTDVQLSYRKDYPKDQHDALSYLWNVTYWVCFLFTWVLNPIIASFVNSADFTITARMKASIKENILVYVLSLVVTALGFLFLVFLGKMTWEGIPGVMSAAGNVFGLLVCVLLLAYGMVDLPRCIWRYSCIEVWKEHATRKIGKIGVQLEDAVEELKISSALTNNMSQLIPKRDELRGLMDQILDEMTSVMPLSRVGDVELGDLDLDYELDHEGLVSLRKRCKRAVIVYNRTLYQYKRLIASVKHTSGKLENMTDNLGHAGLLFREISLKLMSIFCVALSLSLMVAEGTLSFGKKPDASVVSILLRVFGGNIVPTYCMILVFLAYFCLCAYHSLFKLKVFSYYYLVPNYTDGYSLLLNASMLSRFTAPLCYNFITLTKLKHTALTNSALAPMGTVPFFGRDFNTYYPIMGCLFFAAVSLNWFEKLTRTFKLSPELRFEDDDSEGDNSFFAKGQRAVNAAQTEFEMNIEKSQSPNLETNLLGDQSRKDKYKSKAKPRDTLDADERYRQVQKRMQERLQRNGSSRGATHAREAHAGRGSTRGEEEEPALDANATASQRLESMFKGLLS